MRLEVRLETTSDQHRLISIVLIDQSTLVEYEAQNQRWSPDLRYAGAFKPDNRRKPFVFTCSCFCIWPGNLINPRQIEYVGEARAARCHPNVGVALLPFF